MPAKGDIAVIHTRPAPIVRELNALGYRGIACPVLKVMPVKADIPDADIYIVTSVHAVSSVPSRKPVIAVGEKTRAAAEKKGLKIVGETAFIRDLKKLKIPARARLVHLSGRHISPDTKPVLNALHASRVCVYEALPARALPKAVLESLEKRRLAGVLVFSARGAQAFTALAKRATTEDAWKRVTGVALSPRIALAMSGLPLASMRVAARPNRNEILKALRS